MGVFFSFVDFCIIWWDRSGFKEIEENGKENEKSWYDVSFEEMW